MAPDTSRTLVKLAASIAPPLSAPVSRAWAQAEAVARGIDLTSNMLADLRNRTAHLPAGPIDLKAAIDPFRIAGDTYYAGTLGHSVYAIKTPQGVILIDNGWGDTTAKVEASLTKLGVKLTDIKIMVITGFFVVFLKTHSFASEYSTNHVTRRVSGIAKEFGHSVCCRGFSAARFSRNSNDVFLFHASKG